MKKIVKNSILPFIKNKQKRALLDTLLSNKLPTDDYIKMQKQIQLMIDSKHKNNGGGNNLIGYNIKGENNKIILIENGIERDLKENEKISGLNIKINGNNNLIKLELPINAQNSLIQIGTDNTPNDGVIVEIGTTSRFFNVWIECTVGRNQVCKIGKNTTISGVGFALNDQNAGCIVGEDCKFSNSIRIFGSDGHSIVDKDTKECLNSPKGYVTIGNHCWIGEAVRITKNARIGNHCIVGGGAVAHKDYKEDNVIIAGNPGLIVKRGISWERPCTYFYQKRVEQNK